MSKIPADVKSTALLLYRQLGRGSGADEDAIAKAIFTERVRCAEVARRMLAFCRYDKRGGRGNSAGDHGSRALGRAQPGAAQRTSFGGIMSDVTIPEDIPADIWKYAEAVERAWRDLPPRQAVEHHARAILAERERCAKIAGTPSCAP